MANQSDRFRDELEHEIAMIRELALRSTDPLVVAKAIAASDQDVKQLLIKRLEGGERLVEVAAFSGKAGGEVQVFFRFVSGTGAVQIGDNGFLAVVNLDRNEGVGIIDPFQFQRELHAARPFVTISRQSVPRPAADEEATRKLIDQQQLFFERMGLTYMMRDDGWGGVLTVVDTPVTTHKWSGNPRRPDRTEQEWTDDYRDCGPATGGILA